MKCEKGAKGRNMGAIKSLVLFKYCYRSVVSWYESSCGAQMVFIEYDGVMKVMRMIEECAQQMEKIMGLK
jgi:hypothetical protein